MKYFDTVEAAILKCKEISFLRRLSYNFFSVHTEEIITKKNDLKKRFSRSGFFLALPVFQVIYDRTIKM